MSAVREPAPSELRWSHVVELGRTGNEPPPRRVEKTDAEWRAQLSDEEYQVARKKGTERPFSSEMCALFSRAVTTASVATRRCSTRRRKFDSGTGWPSFTQPLERGVVAYHFDTTYGMQRVETICNVCDAHLGHVFPDGPQPSGLRFCINAVSLRKAKTAE